MKDNFPQTIYKLVADIPAGKVATYGQLAFLVGSPRAARIVGAVLARVPENFSLPCHRVIYANGALCPHHAFGHADLQRQMLEMEGITFLPDGRVNLKEHLWKGLHETSALL